MNASFKPTKIALFISALISSAAFAATPASVIIDSSTAAAGRIVNLPSGSNVSFINVSVDDALVTM